MIHPAFFIVDNMVETSHLGLGGTAVPDRQREAPATLNDGRPCRTGRGSCTAVPDRRREAQDTLNNGAVELEESLVLQAQLLQLTEENILCCALILQGGVNNGLLTNLTTQLTMK